MIAIATALRTKITADSTLTTLGADLYFGNAPRGSDYPHITFMPTSDVPLRRHSDVPLSMNHWDFKIWGKTAKEVGDIYEALISIFNAEVSSDFVISLWGRGLPMMTEVNRPNEIIYSRIIECEVIK